ncbi:hypothetical protein BGZ72_004588 [Mortierella alpina]|nr:hypothetical protein BGZ72_004588 [Mortierella alpina]
MSKKLAAQALDALLSSQSTISKKNTSTVTSTTVLKKKTKKGKVQKDRLPATKTGLKKIKHELRYGHSVRRKQEEKEAKENPLGNVVQFLILQSVPSCCFVSQQSSWCYVYLPACVDDLVEKLKSQQEKEQAIVERNLNYYKVTNRVSKKELELRKKVKIREYLVQRTSRYMSCHAWGGSAIKLLRERSKGESSSRKIATEQDESDGDEGRRRRDDQDMDRGFDARLQP